MIVTGYLDWEQEYVSRTLTDVYEGLESALVRRKRKMNAIEIKKLTKKYKDVARSRRP